MTAFDDRPDWQAYANCQGLDPDVFFPARGDNEGVTAALAVCAGCTVRDDCLEYALTEGIKHGVWGGRSTRDRRRLQTERRKAGTA